MFPPTPQQLVAGCIALGLLLAAVGVVLERRQDAHGATPAAAMQLHSDGSAGHGHAQGNEGALVVDVSGAVRRPGVYRLPAGSRVLDALQRAGGPTARAQASALNRAAPLVDGQQVLVPETQQGTTASGPQGAAGEGRAPVARVSINSADVESLDALEGVGPVTAAKIVQDRQKNGPFRTVDDLDRVPGIGPATVEALRESVTL